MDGANLVADAMQALGIRGVCAVVGGAKATAKITVPHKDLLLSGKTVRGIMGGGGTTPDFHLALMRLQAQGRFPLERLVRRYPFAEVNQAVDDSDSGEASRPFLMMVPGARLTRGTGGERPILERHRRGGDRGIGGRVRQVRVVGGGVIGHDACLGGAAAG